MTGSRAKQSCFEPLRHPGHAWSDDGDHIDHRARRIPVVNPPTAESRIATHTLVVRQPCACDHLQIFEIEPPRRKIDSATQPMKPGVVPHCSGVLSLPESRVTIFVLAHLHE